MPLQEAIEKSSGVGRFLWLIPERTVLRARIHLESTGTAVSEALSSLANCARSLADLPTGFRFDARILLSTYLDALYAHGLATQTGTLRLSLIGKAYHAATEPWRMVPEFEALPKNPAEAESQVSRLLRQPRTGTHPLRHLLIIRWLFGAWPTFWTAYTTTATRSATSSAERDDAKSGATDPRRTKFLNLICHDGCSVTMAAKLTDIGTATGMAWAATAGLSSVRRPKKLKPKIRHRLVQDLSTGMEKAKAAEKYGVSVQTITTTLRTEVGLRDKWIIAKQELARKAARSTWEQIKKSYPDLGKKGLRSLEPAAYAWLYRNDGAWLSSTDSTLTKPKRARAVNVDWDQRDMVLAVEVQRAALTLAAKRPRKTIKLWELYQIVPELKAKLSRLNRLPMTKKAIDIATRSQRNDSRQLFNQG